MYGLGTRQSHGPKLSLLPGSLTLFSAADAVIFAESLETVVLALKALYKKGDPMETKVSWKHTRLTTERFWI